MTFDIYVFIISSAEPIPKWHRRCHPAINFNLMFFYSFSELGLTDGQELVVADETTPNALIFKLKYET